MFYLLLTIDITILIECTLLYLLITKITETTQGQYFYVLIMFQFDSDNQVV